jgi:uncharacterized protein (DUF58 family)
MIDLEFIKQLKKLDILAKKKIISSYAGVKHSIKQGRGIEPTDHREYFPGDDLKFVDWKVYGRTERLFIKRFEEEKSLTTHILVDVSNSMNFGSADKTKFDYASTLAAGFAYLVTKENEKFGMATFNSRLEDVLQPKRGRKHFFKAVDVLNQQRLGDRTNLDDCSEGYAKMIKTRSLVVVISDFLEPIETIRKGLFRLAKKSKNLVVIHVADPAEIRLNWQGDMKLYDLETDQIKKIFFTPKMRNEYAVKFIAHLERVRKICDNLGADFFSVTSDLSVFDVFFEITHITTRGHRARA